MVINDRGLLFATASSTGVKSKVGAESSLKLDLLPLSQEIASNKYLSTSVKSLEGFLPLGDLFL